MTDSPAPEAPAAPRRSSARNILTVMTGTLASRVLGLVRQLLFNLLFPLPLKDAFNVAYRIPNLFRELLAEGALVNAIIPVYKSLDPAERARFAGSLTTALFAANALVVGLGVLFAREVVWAVEAMAGLSGQASSLDTEAAVLLTRIMMPFLSGISFAALAMALLNSEERFSATAFSPLAFSVVSIAGFLAFPGSAVALAWVTTFGGFAQLLVQVPALRRHGLLPSPRLAWHPALGRTLLLMAPFAFTTGTRQFLTIILQALLIRFPTGAVTGFNNADAVFQLFLGLFAVSPALASYPRLSEQAQRGEWPAFRDTVSSYLRLILFLCLP
ncbi:MAG TPA: murein biosynthesis integral membrane protein MurJ, partial [Deinococcales bacterium]|nr:murein biosynthesis integral membrane protein MurJ [Deinococcales bacterium]